MAIRLPFVLYATSVGLVGLTGWQVRDLLPLRGVEARALAQREGVAEGTSRITVGRGRGDVAADWYYTNENREWWAQLPEVNFIGKRPEPARPRVSLRAGGEGEEGEPETPLEDILALRLLVCDSADGGRGALSHVVVCYKQAANVTPPDWYLSELESISELGRGGRAGTRIPAVRQPIGSGPYLQKLWVRGGDDERRSPRLWPPYAHIRLVRVSETAQSAFFVRELASKEDPAKVVDGPEEQLIRTSTGIPQGVLATLAGFISGSPGGAPLIGAAAARQAFAAETRQVEPGIFNVGSRDSERFRDEGALLDSVSTQPYRSPVGGTRGIRFLHVRPEIAASFGVDEQDVMISVNGRAVRTEAEAIRFGKREYEKGVRTFVTEWLSGGREITRTYNLEP